jgi:Ca-activated chloride channel family protein
MAPKDVAEIQGPGAQPTRGVGLLEVLKDAKRIALPLGAVSIAARVADRIAHVTVMQTFRNDHTEPLEAVYIFPLSGGCAVSDFVMKVGGRTIRGLCRERGEARARYDQALKEGRRAALLEQERDDVFTVQVGNLPPGEEVAVTITYSERLPYFDEGTTELRLPLVVAPRYIAGAPLDRPPVGEGVEPDTDRVPDASRITPPRLAEGFDPRTALDLEVTLEDGDVADLACSQHATKMAMGEALKVTLARKDELLNRDFVLRWRLATGTIRPTLFVSNGTAMLSILPPKRDGFLGLARDVVFIVDRSASMSGVKMASAARACSILLHTLGPRDRFAMQAFDDRPEWMAGGFTAADEAGVAKGDAWLRTISDRGGTEMDAALQSAIEAVAQRSEPDARSAVLVFITDGEVGDESHVLKRVQTELGDARIFAVGIDTAVNSGFLKKLATLGGGTCTIVAPGDALDEALRSVGREIGAPIVTDLVIEGGSEFAPSRLPDLFEGRAATVFFTCGKGAKVRVRGRLADGGTLDVTLTARPTDLPAVTHLWARARIADLEDEFRLTGGRDGIRRKVIELATTHTLLSRFTAFVVVDEKEIVKGTEEAVRVVQPVHLPDAWVMKGKMDELLCEEGGLISEPMAFENEVECAEALPPPPAPVQAPRAKSMLGGLFGSIFGGGTRSGANGARKCRVTVPIPDPREIERAFAAVVAAWDHIASEVAAGRVPARDALAKSRAELLKALAGSELGQRLAAVQRFARTALAELVAALAGGSPAGSLQALLTRHAKGLAEAKEEIRQPGRFWEATV